MFRKLLDKYWIDLERSIWAELHFWWSFSNQACSFTKRRNLLQGLHPMKGEKPTPFLGTISSRSIQTFNIADTRNKHLSIGLIWHSCHRFPCHTPEHISAQNPSPKHPSQSHTCNRPSLTPNPQCLNSPKLLFLFVRTSHKDPLQPKLAILTNLQDPYLTKYDLQRQFLTQHQHHATSKYCSSWFFSQS